MSEQFVHEAKKWLGTLPEEGVQGVVAALRHMGKLPQTNGVVAGVHTGPMTVDNPYQPRAEQAISVTRTPTADLIVQKAPVYVDVFGLLPLWSALAFNENVLIKGPKGVGKSLSVTTFAHAHKIPLVQFECSEDSKKTNLSGTFTLKNRETMFVLGAIPTAIDVANEVGHCILDFEEINALTPQVQKMLNAVLDFRKSITIPEIGKTYSLREGAKLWVVATMNPSIYGGTYDLNEDLKSRVEEIEIGYPTFELEKQILKATAVKTEDAMLDQVLRFAQETRQAATGYALSTRDLVRLVNTIAAIGPDAALQLVACKFEGDDRATIISRIKSNFKGATRIVKHWGATF